MSYTTCLNIFRLVAPDFRHNKTLRLSDYFKHQETLSLVQTGNNFDDILRGLQLQWEKRADPNIDKEVCSLKNDIYILYNSLFFLLS